jgi:hypothetical protein
MDYKKWCWFPPIPPTFIWNLFSIAPSVPENGCCWQWDLVDVSPTTFYKRRSNNNPEQIFHDCRPRLLATFSSLIRGLLESMTVNAKVMKLTASILNFSWFGCFPHTLSLVIKDGFKNAYIQELINIPDRNSRPNRAPKTYQWDVWDSLKYKTSKSRPF